MKITSLIFALGLSLPLLLNAAEPAITGSTQPPAEPSSLWFDAPASVKKGKAAEAALKVFQPDGLRSPLAEEARLINFLESLPIGNGRLGAMDCGGVDLERIILNESSVWAGGDYDANKPEAHKSLAEIRKLLFAGEVKAAEKLLNKEFSWVGRRYDVKQFGQYETLGDLLIKFPDDKSPASDYRRDLNLMTGTVSTSYQRGGVRYSRELIASKDSEVIALRLKVDRPGSLNFLATLTRPAQAKTSVDGQRFILSGQLNFDWPGGVGTSYRAELAATAKGGKIQVSDTGLEISGADEVVLLLSAGTDLYDKTYAKLVRDRLDAAAKQDFDALKSATESDHRAYMARCTLELPTGPQSSKPTPERLKAMKAKDALPDPALEALYFQFGRHLLISGSRPDSQLPNNLQGIWAEEITTPWKGDFHSNINVQMNYWPAEVTNLSDCHLPLMKLIALTAKKGEATAKAYYDAPGWMCFHTQNPWGFAAMTNSSAGSGSTCGAWLAQHIWMHYDFTRDAEFLRQYYPVLRGASEFALATLVKDPKSGKLVTSPSNSPENDYKLPGGQGHSSLTYGATYDMQILRDLFKNTATAARLLKLDSELVAKLDAALAEFAPTRVNSEGRISEWIEDYEETDPHHRHSSPLWGLHPGNEITTATPELFKGARLLLERRGDASTGWSMAWKANFWARLHDGDRSRKLLDMLINRGAPNFFCLHPPFQIDGNFGGTAAIAEMLIQSQGVDAAGQPMIDLLPALPAAWSSGQATGLRARGNFELDLRWKDGKLTDVTLRSLSGQPATLNYAGKTFAVPAGKGEIKFLEVLANGVKYGAKIKVKGEGGD